MLMMITESINNYQYTKWIVRGKNESHLRCMTTPKTRPEHGNVLHACMDVYDTRARTSLVLRHIRRSSCPFYVCGCSGFGKEENVSAVAIWRTLHGMMSRLCLTHLEQHFLACKSLELVIARSSANDRGMERV